jgi:hypothetical protein
MTNFDDWWAKTIYSPRFIDAVRVYPWVKDLCRDAFTMGQLNGAEWGLKDR